MKVLVVSNMYPSDAHPVFGGFVARQVEALRAAGIEIEVAANDEPATGPLVNPLKYARLARRASREARQGGIDIVHAHYLYPTAIIGARAARAAHLPLVLTAHGNDVDNAAASRFAGRVSQALSEAAAIVAVSRHLARNLAEKFPVEPDTIEIIDCGVDTDLFKPMDKADARLLLDLPADTKVVVFAGYLSESKGIGTLLAAHRKLVAQDRHALLVVLGGGPMAADVATAARDPKVKGLVRVAGEVRHDEMPHWMAAADVVAVPSHREGFGLVALEAMACGAPVLASDVGGLPEIVTYGKTGLLVPPADPDRLAGAIEKVLSENLAPTFAEAARRTAEQHSIKRQAQRLVSLYEGLVG